MHKPVLVKLSSAGRSPGHLAKVGEVLGRAGINIGAVGGAEWEGSGAIAILLDHPRGEDNSDEAVRIIEDEAKYEAKVIAGVTVELEGQPGELGRAARRLADAGINIASILVAGGHGPRALVSFGVDPADEDEARKVLGAAYSLLAD